MPNAKHLSPATTPNALTHWLMYALLAAITVCIIWKGWLTEDAFIGFRALDNFRHGLGLNWAADLRAQIYTNPLWMLLHIPLMLILEDIKVVAFALSFATCAGLLYKCYRHYYKYPAFFACCFLLPLLLSKCFIEYSTSGLENPLSHLIAAFFFLSLFSRAPDNFSVMEAASLAVLAILNRQDHALLYAAPILLLFLLRRSFVEDITGALLAAIPLLFWFAFTIFYYGSVLPDTYYVKMTAGIDRDLTVLMGITYLLRFVENDLVSFSVIIAAITLSFWSFFDHRRIRREPVLGFIPATAFGLALYMIYVIFIGGDYMTGRFFSTPFIVGLILLTECLALKRQSQAGTERTATLCFVTAFIFTILFPNMCLAPAADPDKMIKFGVFDISRFSWNFYLRTWDYGTKDIQAVGYKKLEESLSQPPGRCLVEYAGSAGVVGYLAGPRYYMIDYYGLTDPLMARLPAKNFAPGHYSRALPDGYKLARETQDTSAMHPKLREYYEALRYVKSGPLFSWNRVKAATQFALGSHNHLLADYVHEISSQGDRKADFWMTMGDRAQRIRRAGREETQRGPLFSWYADIFAPVGENKP